MTVKHPRPTSPHLQVYRLPFTALLSITHRFTGVLLSVGLGLVVLVFYAISKGPDSYATMQSVAAFWLVRMVYWGFVFALFFHLCHGIRHLYWDIGESFDKQDGLLFGLYELLGAVALTLGVWFFV